MVVKWTTNTILGTLMILMTQSNWVVLVQFVYPLLRVMWSSMLWEQCCNFSKWKYIMEGWKMKTCMTILELCGRLWSVLIHQHIKRINLFLCSLMGENTKWLNELPRDSITSCDELTKTYSMRLFSPSNMKKLGDCIHGFKCLKGEPMCETLLQLMKFILQYPNYWVTKNMLLQHFCMSLDSMNN